MRTPCLAGDLELLRATAEQTTNASNSDKKNNHLYIYTGLCGLLRRAFRSRIRSLRCDLCGCRFPQRFGGGGGARLEGRGSTASLRGMPTGGLHPQPPAFPGPEGPGAAARAGLPKLTLFCHLAPRVQIARAHRLLLHGQALEETQFYGTDRITGTSAPPFFFVFFNSNLHQYFMCRNGWMTVAERGGILCCR